MKKITYWLLALATSSALVGMEGRPFVHTFEKISCRYAPETRDLICSTTGKAIVERVTKRRPVSASPETHFVLMALPKKFELTTSEYQLTSEGKKAAKTLYNNEVSIGVLIEKLCKLMIVPAFTTVIAITKMNDEHMRTLKEHTPDALITRIVSQHFLKRRLESKSLADLPIALTIHQDAATLITTLLQINRKTVSDIDHENLTQRLVVLYCFYQEYKKLEEERKGRK